MCCRCDMEMNLSSQFSCPQSADPPHCSESLFLLTKGRYLVARGTTDPEQEEGCVLLLGVENSQISLKDGE